MSRINAVRTKLVNKLEAEHALLVEKTGDPQDLLEGTAHLFSTNSHKVVEGYRLGFAGRQPERSWRRGLLEAACFCLRGLHHTAIYRILKNIQ